MVNNIKFPFLIPKGTPLHSAIKAFYNRSIFCHNEAIQYAKRVSGLSVYLGQGGTTISGGVHALYFPKGTPIPEGWRVERKLRTYKGLPAYRPQGNTKVGKAIRKEINELPVTSIWEFNEVIGIDPNCWNYPGLHVDNQSDQIILTLSKTALEAWNKPDYAEEITATKFFELTENKEVQHG